MGILKKALATITFILIIFASSITTAVTFTKGKVNTETLRLRKEASLESTVLELLSKDDEVEIVAEEGDWYKVNFKTYTGYVSKQYIRKNDKSQENPNPKQDEDNDKNNEDTNKTSPDENNTSNKDFVNKQATTNSDLDVYILPLINSNIIGNLKQNIKVDIVNVTGVWAYIKTESLSGWIRVDKISISDSNTIQNNNTNNQNNNNSDQTTRQDSKENETNNNKTTTSSEKEYTPKNYYIKSSAVNVRSKSNTSSNIVTTLTQNTQVKAIGEEGDWYKVEVNGKSGYILKSLLSTNKVEVTSRSSTTDRQTTNNSKQQNTNNNKTQESTATNSSKGEEIVSYAKKFLGRKYVYGGSGPNTFDCSGFTMYVYKHFGYSMGHSAVTQAGLGKYVSKSNLQPGDLVIFNDSANRSIGHVGIYIGGGNFIHASSGGGRIMISSLSGSYYNTRYVTGRRII